MSLALVFAELVKAIGFVVAGLDGAGELWISMLLDMTTKVTSTTESCGTAHMSARDAVATGMRVGSIGGNLCGGKRRACKGYAITSGGNT